MAENEDNIYYHSVYEIDGTLDWERVCDIESTDIDVIKKCSLKHQFLMENHFGK